MYEKITFTSGLVIFQPVEEPKPRKPAGAVSMFGGVDIASAVLKKRTDSQPQDREEKAKGLYTQSMDQFSVVAC